MRTKKPINIDAKVFDQFKEFCQLNSCFMSGVATTILAEFIKQQTENMASIKTHKNLSTIYLTPSVINLGTAKMHTFLNAKKQQIKTPHNHSMAKQMTTKLLNFQVNLRF